MNDLLKFKKVNTCETPEELAQVIREFADPETGMIIGRKRPFDAQKMAGYVTSVVNEGAPANLLTREFGIRQQALYLKYRKYNEIEVDSAIAESIRFLKNFKQGALLENSLFTSEYKVSNDILESRAIPVTEIVHRELANQMASGILEKYKDLIEAEESREFPETRYRLELLVIPVKHLKHIVEYSIRQIPEEKLSTKN